MKKIIILLFLLVGCKNSNDEQSQVARLIGNRLLIDETYVSISMNEKDSIYQSAISE